MAEFSKEYLEAINSDFAPDFSYKVECSKQKQNVRIPLVCEGFGTVAYENINGECYLFFNQDETPDLLDSVLQKFKNQ